MKKFVLLGTAAAVLAPSGPAMAQQVDEIIVTAQKRSESLQDVPVSVVAATGETIADMGITKAEDLSSIMPAVTIAQNPIGNFVFIRGIGTPGANQGIEQSVSIFHDGVYMGRHQQSRAPFMDLERIEVLRGPQSILFGKNTIGGAIHVITAAPSDDFMFKGSALVGSHGETEFNAVVSGALTDGLRGRVSFRKYDMDGYLTNVVTGEDGPARDDFTIRTQLEADLSPDLTVRAKWERSQFRQGQQSSQLAVTNPLTAGAAGVSGLNQALVAAATGGTGVEVYDRERAVDNDGGALLGTVVPIFAGLPGFPDLKERSNNKMDLFSLTVDWNVGDHTLTAITGYSTYKYDDICDCDFAALPLIQVDAEEDYEQFSQEIRLASPTGGPVEYILGAYYHDSDLYFRSIESFGSALAFQQVGVPTPLLVPNLTRDYVFTQKQKQWAIFGSLTWNATDTTRLNVGLRYFNEKKTAGHVLDKRFTGGWDYSALVAAPPGTIAFDDTAAGYDLFLSTFGTTNLGGGVTPGFITEAVYGGLLGTFEHNIIGRKRKEDDINWTVTLEQDLAPDVMTYATVATGTKGGGFDARFLRDNASPFFEYDEESAISYEIGLKSKLFNNAVRANLAFFWVDVDDFQVSIFDGATAFFVDNAAKVRSRGVELDMTWAATNELTFNFAGSYLDAKYRDFQNAPCWAATTTFNPGNCIGVGTPTAFRDASGERLQFAPEWSGSVGFKYEQPVSDNYLVSLNSNVSFQSKSFTAADLDPRIAQQNGYAKIDARLAFGHIDGKWEIAVLGKNLTNKLTSLNSNDQPLVPGNGFALTSRPRSFAVQASVEF